MAKKTVKNNTIVKTADILKKQVKNIHEDVLVASDNFVEESIATGEKWQKIFAKALKGGTKLFAKQQEFTLDTIEMLKGQVKTGNLKIQNLFEFKVIEEAIEDAKGDFKKATKKARKEAKKVAKNAKKAVASIELPNLPTIEVSTKKTKVASKATAKKATAKVKKATKAATTVAKKAKKVVKPTAKKTVKKVAKKVTKPTAKKAAKKVTTTNKKVTAKNRTQKNDLTIINGIGPKVNQLLNKAGIVTFKQLSVTKIADLKNILDAAGSRYKLINPGTWKAEAKLASQNKFELLKEFQLQNKK